MLNLDYTSNSDGDDFDIFEVTSTDEFKNFLTVRYNKKII